jgi:transglutaminase/protease-like cytokinesis protein 3
VCTGYAQAVTLLGEAAGLESVIVTGYADGGVTTGGHAWNKVLVDGQWLVVDATWDDNEEDGVGRDYFLLSASDPALATRVADADWVVDARLAEYSG